MKRLTLLSTLPLFAILACDSPVDVPAMEQPGLIAFDNIPTGEPLEMTNSVTPSTNEANLGLGWAHVLFVDVAVGQVTLDFVSTRAFSSCFEYRIDNGLPSSPTNYNPDINDGLWPYYCENNSDDVETIAANQYVNVRMVFGGETDERFGWTRFYVLSLEKQGSVQGW